MDSPNDLCEDCWQKWFDYEIEVPERNWKMKDRVDFFLNRIIKGLEEQGCGMTHEEMAEARYSYERRQNVLKFQEDHKSEYEAWLWLKEKLNALD